MAEAPFTHTHTILSQPTTSQRHQTLKSQLPIITCPNCFNPILSSINKPNLSLSRVRVSQSKAALKNRSSRLLIVSALVVGNSEAYPKEDPKDANLDIKLPRRSLLVQFTCNECGERSQRLINRLAYERGLVFVQCAGCERYHKLADNLGLVIEYDLRDEAGEEPNTDQV